jgi:hypothetical protein
MKRHHNSKHIGIKDINIDEYYMCEKVHSPREKVHSRREKVHSLREKVHSSREKVHSKFICNKCNKKYKSNRYLIEHKKNCKGIDEEGWGKMEKNKEKQSPKSIKRMINKNYPELDSIQKKRLLDNLLKTSIYWKT